MLRCSTLKRIGVRLLLIFVLVPHLLCAEAVGGSLQTLLSQLTSYYRLSTVRLVGNGAAEIEPGQILLLKRDGLVGFSEASQAMEEICPTTFRGGELRPERNTLCTLASGHSAKSFHAGETLCVSSITESADKDAVSMYVIACSGGRRAPLAHSYYARLVFPFTKGYLRTASAAKVEETIGQVVSRLGTEANALSIGRPETPNALPAPPAEISAQPAPAQSLSVPALAAVALARGSEAPQQPVGEQVVTGTATTPVQAVSPSDETAPAPVPEVPSSSAPQPIEEPEAEAVPPLPPLPAQSSEQAPSAAAPAQIAPQPEAPANSAVDGVTAGESIDQVRATLGDPERIADLGDKVIYFYSRLKIVFGNGKVLKVEEPDSNQ